MAHTDVRPYADQHRSGVVRVLRFLWGDDLAQNNAHFAWKYVGNPQAIGVPGMVAVCDGEVVGFRGYFPAEVSINGSRYRVLRPGDTCIHPDRRRTSLSVAMGRVAMDVYGSNHSLFLNLSCTRSSLPGYLRLGFHPVAPKFFTTRTLGLGLPRYILSSAGLFSSAPAAVELGQFGAVTVSDQPRPEAMARLCAERAPPTDRIVLVRDRALFSWRFASPRYSYLFYYHTEGGVLRAFVVVGLSPNRRRAYILDHAQVDRGALEELISFIIFSGHFDVLSMLNFGADADTSAVLKKMGLSNRSAVRLIERGMNGELPVLVRPVRRDFQIDDFKLDGIDTRRPESWNLEPIVSDAV